MKKFLKWTGFALIGIILLVSLALTWFNFRANERLAKKYSIDPVVFEIPSDSVSLQHGAHWVEAICMHCHGDNLAGKLYSNTPGFAKFYSSNLTRGKGGVGSFYTDKDWIRSIRHGVAPDGRGLITMPSSDYNHLSAADVGGIIAYLKTVPPVDNVLPRSEMLIIAKTLLVNGKLDGIISAEVINHSLPPPQAPTSQMAAQFGGYLVDAIGCRTCHGKALNGMQPPMPGAPFAPNLTTSGELPKWSKEDFRKTLQTGIDPTGKKLDGKFMPLSILGKLKEEEIDAIFAYLSTI